MHTSTCCHAHSPPLPQRPELIHTEDENGLSPLATAAEVGDTEIAATLLDKVGGVGSGVRAFSMI